MPKQTKKSKAVLLNMPADMKADVERLAKEAELSESDVMRMALRRGIERLEEMFSKPTEKAA